MTEEFFVFSKRFETCRSICIHRFILIGMSIVFYTHFKVENLFKDSVLCKNRVMININVYKKNSDFPFEIFLIQLLSYMNKIILNYQVKSKKLKQIK